MDEEFVKQYYMVADPELGLMICMDDGEANYVYSKGEGYVKDPLLLKFLWPNSKDFGSYRELNEEQAREAERQVEAGERLTLPEETDAICFGAPWAFRSESDNYKGEPLPENFDSMSQDDILEQLKKMF